ncbi:MAG TPA: hypothetical protein VF174_15840 [Micromonosporaceae bacterium]
MARRGRPNITLRLDEELWQRLGALTEDRSALLREFIRWYVREPGAKLPQRPRPHPFGAEALDPSRSSDRGT